MLEQGDQTAEVGEAGWLSNGRRREINWRQSLDVRLPFHKNVVNGAQGRKRWVGGWALGRRSRKRDTSSNKSHTAVEELGSGRKDLGFKVVPRGIHNARVVQHFSHEEGAVAAVSLEIVRQRNTQDKKPRERELSFYLDLPFHPSTQLRFASMQRASWFPLMSFKLNPFDIGAIAFRIGSQSMAHMVQSLISISLALSRPQRLQHI